MAICRLEYGCRVRLICNEFSKKVLIMMYSLRYIVAIFLILVLVGCHEVFPDKTSDDGKMEICIGPMEGQGAVTRSDYTMWPEEENCIKTLAFFQFDPEGLHNREELFHFRNFVTESTPDGVLRAEITDVLFKNYNNKKTTVCVVGNITEEEVNEFYAAHTSSTSSQVLLDDFKKWRATFKYKEDSDSLGHLKEVYTFGYYHGLINADNRIARLIMGRLCSRIEIVLTAENNTDFAEGVDFSFDNVPTQAFYFSGENGAMDTLEDGLFGTNDISVTTDRRLFYFYMPGNSAKSAEEALTLKIVYNNQVKTVTLCTLPPDMNMEYVDYGINRNSIYRFRINLKKKVSTRTNVIPATSENTEFRAFAGEKVDVCF